MVFIYISDMLAPFLMTLGQFACGCAALPDYFTLTQTALVIKSFSTFYFGWLAGDGEKEFAMRVVPVNVQRCKNLTS